MQWLKFVTQSLVLYLAFMSPEVWGIDICPAPAPCTCTGNQVDCASKKFTEVPDFIPVTSHREIPLLTVSLQDNAIETLEKFSFTLLKATKAQEIVLNLAGNQIDDVSKDAFVGIEYKITELYLQDNRLNQILPFLEKFWKLKTLDLSNNKISVITGKALKHLRNLLTFNLGGNPMWYIDQSSFYGLGHVAYLYVDRTRLRYIPQAITTLPDLTYLSLEDAPVNCTCELYQDKHWLESKTVEIIGSCSAPADFVDMPIKQYIKEEFSMCPW